MILPDTNIWIAHFGEGEPALAAMLSTEDVAMHPHVTAELALGRLVDRENMLADFAKLEAAPLADHADVMRLIETAPLFGSGIGYVDAHLIASCLALPGLWLWTRDRRLRRVAAGLGILAMHA